VSRFDNPLSSQFDENDAVLYFDDVKVPWERVFVNQDIEMTLQQFHGTPAHVLQNYQCQIRLLVKLRFLAGIAQRIAEANGIVGFPQVRDTFDVTRETRHKHRAPQVIDTMEGKPQRAPA
jgi:4-hydroxyphenylacetate 3-monooxygenase